MAVYDYGLLSGFLFPVDTDGYMGLPPHSLQLGHRRSRDGPPSNHFPSAAPSSRSLVEPRNVSSNDMPSVLIRDHRPLSSHGLVGSRIVVGSFSSVSPWLCLLVADLKISPSLFRHILLHSRLRSCICCQTSMTSRGTWNAKITSN